MSDKLKPCKKCGSYNVGVKDSYGSLFPSRIKTWAYCRVCGFKGPVVILRDSNAIEIERAIDAWNREGKRKRRSEKL